MSRDDDRDDYDDEPRGRAEPHRGVLILVLGILGWMVCGLLGTAAWIMGKRDLELMRQGRMDREGEALTRVGYILGLIATILMVFALALVIVFMLLGFIGAANR